jgi:signal transduction histidine kinase
VRLTDIVRTATFRTAALAASAFGASTVLLFLFIYWQAAGLETARIDRFLTHESEAIARENADLIARDVTTRYARDLHRYSFAEIFTPRFVRVSGEVAPYPDGLALDAVPRQVTMLRETGAGVARESVRAVARTLPDGRVLLVATGLEQVAALRELVLHALALGLLPALVSALCIGALASQRALARLMAMNATIARIMQGQLGERLAYRPTDDPFDQLARGVNRMLDEIERLLAEVQGVGDDIAHDLRTPLTRVRARLEGARTRATSQAELATAIDQSIADLDQSFAMITALLRIGQIEGGARRAGFASVSLSAIAREAFDLYLPVAELNNISLSLSAEPDLIIPGDRDLLFEVAANLLDNAVKFTPPGGHVALMTRATTLGPTLTVRDTGPGIPAADRIAVLQRFYRADRSRHIAGHGLGLSLVAAILRLHMFHVHMDDAGPGLLVEMRTWPSPT